ncbi:MAG: GNAT family N-acetyltransferase [Saprospiraceae bacterium]|nr:GNAT family N-acetyltransferase [Saprospiraceae bacterium]
MTEAHLPHCVRLSEEAGWNQQHADWGFLAKAGSEYNLVATLDDQILGTVTALPYSDRFLWIGMMLVHVSYRRQGIGKHLLSKLMENADPSCCFGLDATPLGEKLYDVLGYKKMANLHRYGRPFNGKKDSTSTSSNCRKITVMDLDRIHSFDQDICGVDRSSVLKYLHRSAPDYAWLAESDQQLTGYLMGRPGRLADHLGPMVAASADVALTLLRAALASSSKTFVIDVFDYQKEWIATLNDLGFEVQRPLYRMFRGDPITTLSGPKIFAIAGPELG